MAPVASFFVRCREKQLQALLLTQLEVGVSQDRRPFL